MSELSRALGDISSIRRQVAQSTQFRGYGPETLAATGVVAVLAAAVQTRWLIDPASHLRSYLAIWLVAAAISIALTGARMHTRTRRMHSGLSNEMLRLAVEQFLPSLGAGLAVTVALTVYVPADAWLLPGLWQVIFGLGVFSSCRFLPRTMTVAGAWYLLAGMVCICLGDGRALAPWTMGLGYGGGQLLVAGILYAATPEGSDEE